MKILFKDHPEFAKWCRDKREFNQYTTGLLIKEGRGYWIETEEQFVREDWMWSIENGTSGLFQYLKKHYPEALI